MLNLIRHKIPLYVIPALLLLSCNFTSTDRNADNSRKDYSDLADELETSLFTHIVDAWYPRSVDTLYGGFLAGHAYDWSLPEESRDKALVYQARHLWTLSCLYEHYPERHDLLEYAKLGSEFIQKSYPDTVYGGLYSSCSRDGKTAGRTAFKRSYAHAFAIYGLARYFKVSNDSTALNMAIRTFRWLDEHAHDKKHGGWFESLERDGTPVLADGEAKNPPGYLPLAGLKEFNSSIHILEALSLLYTVWPDSLLRSRLEEMYILTRDVLIHPDGYLNLYFYPDWSLVPAETMESISGGNVWFTQHITYGHDLETAYLLNEAAHALGIEDDRKAGQVMKNLVDHSLQTGWDKEKGGFYYISFRENDSVRIHDPHKSFWTQAEGLNALLLMHMLHPEDSADYYEHFRQLWTYIDSYLIDHEHGGWYNFGLDNYPQNRTHRKSHNWKANYHNVRAMVHCVFLLRKR